MVAVPIMKTVSGDGVKINLAVWEGEGKPILCIHGITANCRCWDGLAAALAPQYSSDRPDYIKGSNSSRWKCRSGGGPPEPSRNRMNHLPGVELGPGDGRRAACRRTTCRRPVCRT